MCVSAASVARLSKAVVRARATSLSTSVAVSNDAVIECLVVGPVLLKEPRS